MSSYNVKYCVVPECHNTSWTARDKLFFSVPKQENIRNIWSNIINGAKDRPPLSANAIHVCEDHFDLENDLENYMKYKMGFVSRVTLKEGVAPSKFDCQRDLARDVHKISKTKKKVPKSTGNKISPKIRKAVPKRSKGSNSQVIGEKTSRGIGIEVSRVTGIQLESELLQKYNKVQPAAGSQYTLQNRFADFDDGSSKDDLSSPIINDVKTDPTAFDEDLTDEAFTDHSTALDEEVKRLETKVCRVCLGAPRRRVHSLRAGALLRAYEALTGLAVERDVMLLPYVCTECAGRLLAFSRFRSRSLRAHALLLGLTEQHDDCITLESISSSLKDFDVLGSNLSVTHYKPDCYDLVITHVTSDDENTDDYEYYDPNVTPKVENEMDEYDIHALNNSNVDEIVSDIKEENMSSEVFELDNDMIKTEVDDSSDYVGDKDIDPLDPQEHNNDYNMETVDRDNMETMHCEAGENSLNVPVDSKSNIEIEIDLNDSATDMNRKKNSRGGVKKRSVAELETIIMTYDKCSSETYSCDYCNFQSCVKSEFMEHVKSHDADLYLCGNCHQSFRLEAALNIHSKQCGKDTSVHSQLGTQGDFPTTSSYIVDNVGADKEALSCRICAKRFNLKASLLRHMSEHDPGFNPLAFAVPKRGHLEIYPQNF